MATGPKAILMDETKCTACRGCQVACKMWNSLPAVATTFFGGPGYQNPADLSFNTFNLIRFLTEIDGLGFHLDGEDRDGDDNWNFFRFSCMHCTVPVCVTICRLYGAGPDPNTAMTVDPATGFVYIDQTKCVGCNSCRLGAGAYSGCPFDVPRPGTDPNPPYGPKNRKCTGCVDNPKRVDPGVNRYPLKANSGTTTIRADSLVGIDLRPSCVTACPNEALQYGSRAAMIAAANARAADADVVAKWPEVNVYGAADITSVQVTTQTNVIYVLTRSPSFYGLPT
jgi:Fe-S-cluster-containing dehydrogenase component